MFGFYTQISPEVWDLLMSSPYPTWTLERKEPQMVDKVPDEVEPQDEPVEVPDEPQDDVEPEAE